MEQYHQITMDEAMEELEKSRRVFCKRCGRELKSKKAKELGFGPSCFKKYIKETEQSNRIRLFTI